MTAATLTFLLRAPIFKRPPHAPHRQICHASAAPPSKKRLIFLGTPKIAARALEQLHTASQTTTSTFDLIAVVTQPPSPSGRRRQLTKSPVHSLAESLSLPALTPSTARDPVFISAIRSLRPDLCITAAYGNFLPDDFLAAPVHGTLNIHPSLLPAFRGAAPVPRALEMGVTRTGVSVLFTVLEMDAGPVVARREVVLDGDEHAPELLETLMDLGVEALLQLLPAVWDGSVERVEQLHEEATKAAKIAREEGRLVFTENAVRVHNKVRAFAWWPGCWTELVVDADVVRVKVLETVVLRREGGMCLGVHEVCYDDKGACLKVVCDDGSVIGVRKLQPPGKKAMDARSFWNGLRGRSVERRRVPH